MYNEAGWLAKDAHELQTQLGAEPEFDCDVLIVGSGYGGAVAAARLAGLMRTDSDGNVTPLSVWVVERGREYLPGMFPSRTGELPGHVRMSAQDGSAPRGNDTALWDVRTGRDVNVLLASGLGGGSLINAAVMERPEKTVWSEGWPVGLDGASLNGAYEMAEQMLQAQPYSTYRSFAKLVALQHLGDGLAGNPKVEPCHIAVAAEHQATPAGVEQKPCTDCGDCATGCNWQAKNSLDVNYLALARRRGAEMFCGVLAQRISKGDDAGWVLRWRPMVRSLAWGNEATPIRTRHLIVCAGSLGSTELLQQSQTEQLRFSQALGSKFSTNGDMIAAAIDLPISTNLCGTETSPGDATGPENPGRGVGPTITGMLRAGYGERRFTVQEFSIPAALRPLLAQAAGTFGLLQKLPRPDWRFHRRHGSREDPLAPGDAAIDRMMVYGLMGDDGAGGRLVGVIGPETDVRWDGRIAVRWREARNAPVFEAQDEALRKAYRSRRGHYVPNPLWRPLPKALDRIFGRSGGRGPLTTVHPLGGCPMGTSATDGVVDMAGRVFDGAAGVTPHKGLAVLDGAIVPRALGINPALTITALAEHAIQALITDWGLAEPDDVPLAILPPREVWRKPTPRDKKDTTSIRLREQLEGRLSFDGEPCWAELEVIFAPIKDLAEFTRMLPRVAPVEKALLRLYPDRMHEDDPQWNDPQLGEIEPRWTVELTGEVHVLFPHGSSLPQRVWRGARALWQLWARQGARGGWRGPLRTLMNARPLLSLASHLGERRGLDYHLHVDFPPTDSCPLGLGDLLIARKLLACTPDANPWRQVSEVVVDWKPWREHGAPQRVGELALDLRHFVRRNSVLVELVRQSDQVTALADIAGLALLFLRAMAKIQVLSFVPPAFPQEARARDYRLPRALPGLACSRFDLRNRRPHLQVKAFLTRYRSTDPLSRPTPGSRPTLLIHGYTASGSTFAHPSMKPNLVQHLCAQGREVWVVELSSSIAFDKEEGKGQSFEAIAEDLPKIIRRVRAESGRHRVDVVAHCIGAAMLCRAVLDDRRLHRSIGAVVLSQVGPLVQMTPANLLRGFVASYLAQYLGATTLDAAPDPLDRPSGTSGPTLADVLLASMPYPDRDLDRALGSRAKAEGRPDFRLVRHRIDAMLGRVMELSEDSPTAAATLDALDDLFGHAHVKTLAQVIHYMRWQMLTDSDGRNRSICHESLRERMPFPVLLLHGRRSGVFDWRGSLRSHEWLRSSLPSELANTSVHHDVNKLHLGLGTSRQLCVFDKLGHQDCITGERAPTLVFPEITAFLDRPLPAAAIGPPPPLPFVVKLPWIGPIVGWVRRTAASPTRYCVSLIVHPSPAHTSIQFLAIVPMSRGRRGRWERIDGVPLVRTGLVFQPDGVQVDPLLDLDGLRSGAFTLSVDRVQVKDPQRALLFLTVHNDLPAAAVDEQRFIIGPPDPTGPVLDSIEAFLESSPHIESGLMRLDRRALAARDRRLDPEIASRSRMLTFAVASCQYPHGLLEEQLAQASYRRLGARLDAKKKAGAPQMLLLLGDQVYVDETAGVFNPLPLGGALELTYERAFRGPAFRAVAARLPTYMLLDDHELTNNSQGPLPYALRKQHELYAQRQASLNPTGHPRRFSFASAPGGWPLFVLDTRNWRRRRTPDNFDEATIVRDEVMDELQIWLLAEKTASEHGPKFIAMSVVLLPFERDAGQRRWSSDSWAGYPASRARLLTFIRDNAIRNVVFLAGDPHVSMVSKLLIDMTGTAPIAAYSVVSSGLYAPWLFSNAEPCDFQLAGSVGLATPGWPLLTGTIESIVEPSNGFAVVTVRKHGQDQFELAVELDAAERCQRVVQSLNEPTQTWQRT